MQPKVPSSDQAGYMPQEPVALTIRPATIADAALITRLITRLISELAEFDNALHEARKIEADILPDGFGADPRFRALIAEWLSEPAVFLDTTRRGAEQVFTWRISLFAPDFAGAALESASDQHVGSCWR